jgi:uncharacterized damage-inducible protein DinB
MDARTIAFRVRDALMLLEQQEAAQPQTLIDELEQEAAAGMRTIQGLVDDMARQRRLWLANGMNEAIANQGAEIGGTFSRARWAEIKEAFDQFEQWMQTPLPECGLPPIVVISRRGNPPVQVQE